VLSHDDRVSERLVVQQSFPEPRPTTNPYLVLLRDSLTATSRVDLRTFSWRSALLRRYDVFHVHWPELLFRGTSTLRSVVRQLLTVALLCRLQLTGTPVVRTLHNLERPPGLSRVQKAILDRLERQTSLLILLNPTGASPSSLPSTTIVHGHYREWFAGYEQRPARPGRLSYFGLLRPYKGVDRLLDAFAETADDLTLRIAGQAHTPTLARELAVLAERDSRVRFSSDFLPDEELVRVVTESELVVLPYRQMHNSGSALAALSLDRPVLVPHNEVNEQLSREVGEGWVHTYSGELTGQHLTDALLAVRTGPRSAVPDLSRRNWELAADQHVDAYLEAIARPRPARRRPARRRPAR
jgi:beta-1,4-mannosyltransferase